MRSIMSKWGKTYRSDSRILGIDSDLFFSGRI